DRWRGKHASQPGYRAGRIGDIGIYDVDFEPVPGRDGDQQPAGAGLLHIDHLTHNVHRGRMKEWAEFYQRLFNFREVRYFDIEGQQTGLKSKAMCSPCGKIRIPINESSDDHSQISEYLDLYHGEGIQHVALSSSDIYRSVEALRARNVQFHDTRATYFDALDTPLPGHGESLKALRRLRILIDGNPHAAG